MPAHITAINSGTASIGCRAIRPGACGETEALPDGEESHAFSVAYTSDLALSLADPALDIRPLAGNSDAIIRVVAAQLRDAGDAGQLAAGVDADLEAASLLPLSAGLGTSVLAGQRSAGEALAVIRYHLDRLPPTDGCGSGAMGR